MIVLRALEPERVLCPFHLQSSPIESSWGVAHSGPRGTHSPQNVARFSYGGGKVLEQALSLELELGIP